MLINEYLNKRNKYLVLHLSCQAATRTAQHVNFCSGCIPVYIKVLALTSGPMALALKVQALGLGLGLKIWPGLHH